MAIGERYSTGKKTAFEVLFLPDDEQKFQPYERYLLQWLGLNLYFLRVVWIGQARCSLRKPHLP